MSETKGEMVKTYQMSNTTLTVDSRNVVTQKPAHSSCYIKSCSKSTKLVSKTFIASYWVLIKRHLLARACFLLSKYLADSHSKHKSSLTSSIMRPSSPSAISHQFTMIYVDVINYIYIKPNIKFMLILT